MKLRLLAGTALLALILVTGIAQGETCSEQYFAPDDNGHEFPLRRPHRQWTTLQRAARSGDASALRSLAVAYESGYLVSRCDGKAAAWYARAAAAGDAEAKAWLGRRETFAALEEGPECAGNQCRGAAGAGTRAATFIAGPNGHYFAPVTINGVTATGLIDTGASTLAMSEETARKFGIAFQSGTQGTALTANGAIPSKSVTVPQVMVGGITLANVRVSVGIQGQMLIGMNFLGRLNVRMEGSQLTLAQ